MPGITRHLRYVLHFKWLKDIDSQCVLQKSAFIRTAYFNGQYTNQYAQPKFKGHLIYRRFNIPAPYVTPIFTEGAVILPQIKEEKPSKGNDLSVDNLPELDDSLQREKPPVKTDWTSTNVELPACQPLVDAFRWDHQIDDAAKWRQSVLRLLDNTIPWVH